MVHPAFCQNPRCGKPLPPPRSNGTPRKYCSNKRRCKRQALACRQRRMVEPLLTGYVENLYEVAVELLLDEKTYKDVASELGVSSGTVYRIKRAAVLRGDIAPSLSSRDALTKQMNDALRLRRLGYTGAEIAAELELHERKVWRLLKRART